MRREASLLGDEAEFVLLMSSKSRIEKEQLESFARIYRLPIVVLRRSFLSALAYLPALLHSSWLMRGILKRERCDRLQLNEFSLAHGMLLRLLGYRGQIVTWIRVDPARFGSIGSVWLEVAKRSSDRLVAVSAFIREKVALADSDLVFDPLPDLPMLGASAEPNLVLMGNYDARKGQDLAIAAFHRIADKHPDARLLFYGSDMGMAGQALHLSRLRVLATAGSGARRIEFRDFVSDPADALRHARAALSCSLSESFSLVCQEASGYGLPVIATRSGGPEEIIEDGVTGYLVDIGDVDAMADRMDRLLSDVELARTLGSAGAELVRKRFPARKFKMAFRNLFDL